MARPRKFEEAAVVKAALEQFWTTGYGGTSLDDLLRATGLGRGSLYNSFGNKRTLYLQAFADYCTDVVATTAAALDGPDATAARRLEDLLHRIATPTGPPSRAPRSCFLSKATAEMAALDVDVAAISRKTFVDLEALLVKAVEAAQRAGAIPPALDARATGRHVLATMRGIEALAASGVAKTVLTDAVSSLVDTLMPAAHKAS